MGMRFGVTPVPLKWPEGPRSPDLGSLASQRRGLWAMSRPKCPLPTGPARGNTGAEVQWPCDHAQRK
jgi:hypothetical protein